MGHPVNPISLRLGNLRGWESNWVGNKKTFPKNLCEDSKIRDRIISFFPKEIIAKIIIDRTLKSVKITVQTSKPGVLIGSGGTKLVEITKKLKKICDKEVRINVSEVRRAELDAILVGKDIAAQIIARMPYKRVIKQTMNNTMNAGAKGIKICVSGRLAGAEIARREKYKEGRVPTQTLRADIDYASIGARTIYGMIGIKVWIFKKNVYGKRDLSLNIETRKKKHPYNSRYTPSRKKTSV